ncbi:PP2C family protein-serine/threonine phosphatase [Carboxylicivirga taeanensis]|uniref:PP2C family protein-serine/threonine phosphatase n=1 Tax=Carboxylicivirga taeanensis TaxID=1416875 RepID=UPI003F6E2689
MVTQLKKKRLRLYKDRLNIILDIAQTINQDHTIDDLLSEFEILLREELEVGKVLVYTLSNNEWKNLLISGVTEDEAAAIDVKKDLLQYDTIESITLSHPPNLKGFDAVIPLFHRYSAIGYVLIGDIEEEQQGISPTIKHLKLIQIISNLIIVFVENKRMQQELLEQEAIKKEMELASRIQNQLVPNEHQLPKTSKLEIHTYYQPHMGVGGDYYDVFRLSRNTIGFCIADVSGKGISAAMLMSNFQAVIRSLFSYRCNLKKLVHQLNARVNESANNEKFITLFIGRYNLITRRLSYVNAGHLPPLLYDARKQQLTHLESGCIGLGMLDFIPSIELGKVHIPRGSKLLAFTDGLVELDDGFQVESGAEEVEAVMNNSAPLEQNFQGLRTIIDRIEKEGAAFDDISLIGLEFK